jgi:putative two-component system response regulator
LIIDDLAQLARIADDGIDDDESIESALAIVAARTGASGVAFVYGADDGFRDVSSGAALQLTPVALWLIQRDLVTRRSPSAFDVIGARVVRFRDAATATPCAYVACLLPQGASGAEMLILKGPWQASFEHISLLAAVRPAFAMISARRVQQIQTIQERHQLGALMNIAQVVSQSRDTEEVLTDIARGVAAVADVDFVTIDVTNADGEPLLRCVNYDPPENATAFDRWKQAGMRPDPIRQEVVRSRRPALFADTQNDERLSPGARRFFSNSLIRSTAVFPMVAQDQVIGVISIGVRRPMEFSSDECTVFEGLATQAATAVSGIRLYQELAQKSALLEVALQAERERARRDSLTGVWNHAAIADLLYAAITAENVTCVATAMVDVNGMKAVNDTYGHLAGDELLKGVTELLAEEGTLVGRYGGDEFLIVLPNMHRARAQRYVDDITARAAELRIRDDVTFMEIRCSLSVGLALFPDEATDISDLIRAADTAMYAAKQANLHRDAQNGRRLNDRVSQLVEELVPLLTSSADVQEKIALVTQRLFESGRYHAIECRLFREAAGATAHSVLIDGESTDLAEAWRLEQEAHPEPEDRVVTQMMTKTLRPVIIGDVLANEHLTGPQRHVLTAAGIQSVLTVPLISQNQMIGQLSVGSRQADAFQPTDAQFLSSVAAQVTAIVRMATLVDGLQYATRELASAQDETVMMLAAAAEAHDETTGQHLRSIRVISEALATQLGYSEQEVRELGMAATLHDIGKISVPDAILSSPVRFDRDDVEMSLIWEQLQRHSVWGSEFLQNRKGFELASQVARWHHERWDGRGYPDGLVGDQILEKVAIVTVADAYDAMTSDRPYRAGRSAAAAVMEIVRYKGQQFSPRVVDALASLHGMRALPTSSRVDKHAQAA